MDKRKEKFTKKAGFAEKLQKLFSLIPIIYENQGISLSQLRELASYESSAELQKALSRLRMVGKAPFSPTDFISINIESDAVYLDFPQGLEQPLDLTSEEWIALGKLIEWKLHFQKSGQENTDFLADIMKRISSVPVVLGGSDLNQAKKQLLNEALSEECQVEFTYKSLSSKEPEVRRVDPWALFDKDGQSYLIGHCHTRQDVRIFSLLRMDELFLLEEEAKEPCPENVEEIMKSSYIFDAQARGMDICLGFAPELRRFMQVLFGNAKIKEQKRISAKLAERLPEAWFWLETKVASQIWLYEVLIGLGPKAVILSPDFMRQKFVEGLRERKADIIFS